MIRKFTRTTYGWIAGFLTFLLAATSSPDAHSQVLFSEGFDVVAPLPAGWAQQNLSAPVGTTNWFQGNATVFPSQSGAPTAYIAANFNNVAGSGTVISNWLFTPSVTLKDGDIFTFYTRSVTASTFPDRLQVRMSTAGTSTNVGATSTSVGDFTNLLLDINPTYTQGGYPQVWTQYTITISGLGGVPTPGRLAFRYFVEDGGPNGNNSDYMGIDNVVYTTFGAACSGTPTPGNTLSSAASVCPGAAFTLSLQNNPSVSGLTYQWQSSPDGITWTNIAGATSLTLLTQQNTATYYQAIVSCGAASAPSTPLQVTMNAPSLCYCDAGATNTGFEKISNVTLNTINNNSTSNAGYENFTAISTNLEPGLPYPVSVSISNAFAADQVIIWIDYNHNGQFTDAGEQVYTSATGVGPHTGTITVPFTALSGNTRMRVRMHDTSLGANSSSCGNSTYGQVEDYTVNILPVVPCSGTPNPGNTISTVPSVCAGTNFTLSLQNFTSGTGVTYQWQSSPDGTNWTNIAGATNVTYTTSLTATTYYQAIVTCGANSGTSTPVQVALNPPIACYCTPGITNCDLSDVITNVTVGTINNNSGCSVNGYANYTATVAPTDLIQGATTPMAVTVGPGGTEHVAVWIDYNQNGLFEASEFTALGSANGATVNGNITIPANATLGLTGMRVRVRWNTALTGTQACLGYAFGETEDYYVRIVPCVQGTITTQPVNRTIGCSGSTTFSVAATGSALTYRWEYRTSATAPWQFVPNAAPYSGITSPTLTITDAPSTLNGYQYRVIIQGACTATDASAVATLTVGPLVGTVTPTSASICAGSIQSISITNTAPPTTTSFPSGAISQVIPDANLAGTTLTMPVSIPAGAILTGASVTLNISHTWIGDLGIVLRAPNGQILNLDYFISATGAGPTATGFVNTTISSQGTALLSSSTNPYTGTFRADAVVTPGAGNPPTGPTGMLATTNQWTALYSQPNGNWTLGLYDAFNGDQGTVTSWTLTLTYGAPSTGIWSPAAGLFTDPAGTVPYDGTTPVSTVYASPTSSTDYQVVVSNPLCTAAPVIIPVTVSNPLSNVTLSQNSSTCEDGSVTISATAGSGNIVSVQWEVSTDGGTTWTTVTNGGVYSGATSPDLVISNAPLSLSGAIYRAIATNPCNSSTSDESNLIVYPNPTVNITSSVANLVPGEFATLTANVSPNAGDVYTWTLNGLPISGGSQVVADIDMLGNYQVQVEDVNGCFGTSSVFNLGARATEMAFIYPSPNTGHFQVRFYSAPGNVLPRMLNIFDSKGARVYSQAYPIGAPYQRMDVDLTKHGKGIYMVELADRNGNRIKAGRVVVL